MSVSSLDVVLKNAKKSIFRFESLQDYSAEDGEDTIEHFIKTGEIGWDPTKNDFWKMIKSKNKAGIETARVRLITFPLTNYTKWEVASLKIASEFSDENLRFIEQEVYEKIIPKTGDFYLIDDEIIVEMKYGAKGKFLKDKISNVENLKTDYVDIKYLLLSHSLPINELSI